MKLINQTLNKNIDSAIIDAERLFKIDSPMMREIYNKNDFKYNSGRGIDIYLTLLHYDNPINVFTYKPLWRWSRAIGYSDKLGIHINFYKLTKMSHAELVGLLCHEAAHICGFSHGNNFKTKEKCLSVPYFLSENIERWL